MAHLNSISLDKLIVFTCWQWQERRQVGELAHEGLLGT
jgi:hypothetical protein